MIQREVIGSVNTTCHSVLIARRVMRVDPIIGLREEQGLGRIGGTSNSLRCCSIRVGVPLFTADAS